MDQTLRQLGELLLGSVPTVILLALLYALYTAIVHKPLQRVLEERRSKTEGAVEKSRADIAAAEARTSEYEQRLREARASVFRAQEARRKAALDARAAALNQARNQARPRSRLRNGHPERSRRGTGRFAEEAQSLAAEIMRRVLEPGRGEDVRYFSAGSRRARFRNLENMRFLQNASSEWFCWRCSWRVSPGRQDHCLRKSSQRRPRSNSR